VVRVLDLLEQICNALGAAHARGVVHRDGKPDNVFLVRRPDGGEQAKVIDFGVSWVPGTGDRLTRAGAIIGTPEYMAPEQAAGAPIDHRADVYAVGVLAFEMLTGVLPLEAATPLATIDAHRTRTPDPPSRRLVGIPPEVDALVLRALAKRPEERFASMAALAEEITRIRPAVAREPGPRSTPVGRMSTGPQPSSPGRPSRSRVDTVGLPEKTGEFPPMRRSNPAGITVAVLAAVVAAAAAGWAWRMERQAAAAAAPVRVPVDAAPSAPVLGGAVPDRPPRPAADAVPDRAPPLPVADAPPARPRPRRAAKRSDAASGELKDPYSDDAKLKEAFP
jgi:serine/threonine-protein kinase